MTAENGPPVERHIVADPHCALHQEWPTKPNAAARCETCRARPIPPGACPTPGCPGDARYAAPGRNHVEGCTFPIPPGGSDA